MKRIITLLAICLFTVASYAQEATVHQKSSTKFVMDHSLSYEKTNYDRWAERIKTENVEVEKVKITETSVTVTFKKDTPEDRMSKIMLYVATIFQYQTIKIVND